MVAKPHHSEMFRFFKICTFSTTTKTLTCFVPEMKVSNEFQDLRTDLQHTATLRVSSGIQQFLQVDFMANKMLGSHWTDVCVQEPGNKSKSRHCVPENFCFASRKYVVWSIRRIESYMEDE